MTTELKIEKGIPIPVGGNRNGLSSFIRQLEVNDSFIVPTQGRKISTVTASIRVAAQRANIKLSFRKIDGVTRAWRTA